ncbi:MAG: hypothetical protein WDM81_03575 [Rhizomicrobium sp.]
MSRPISLARARYWKGRCFEAQGNTADAYAQYKLASQVPESFYGQIALARIDATPVCCTSTTLRWTRAMRPTISRRIPCRGRSGCWPISAR